MNWAKHFIYVPSCTFSSRMYNTVFLELLTVRKFHVKNFSPIACCLLSFSLYRGVISSSVVISITSLLEASGHPTLH